MTTRKKLFSLGAALALAGLLFAQARPTAFRSILIKAIPTSGTLDVPFEIDLISGQTTTPMNLKNSSGSSIWSVNYQGNQTVGGTLAVTGTSAFTAAITPTGGVAAATATPPCHYYVGDAAPATSTTGTDTTPVNGTLWIGEVRVMANCTSTGISYLIGSVGGTDKVVVALFSSAGAVLANSALDSSVTVGTTATFQRVPFTATYALKGPGKYYVGVQMNGNTARLRTQAFGDIDATSISQTFNTLVAITPPTTFTASKAPIAMLY
jgi:hypothetical protein